MLRQPTNKTKYFQLFGAFVPAKKVAMCKGEFNIMKHHEIT